MAMWAANIQHTYNIQTDRGPPESGDGGSKRCQSQPAAVGPSLGRVSRPAHAQYAMETVS